jgi:hypothetical protein
MPGAKIKRSAILERYVADSCCTGTRTAAWWCCLSDQITNEHNHVICYVRCPKSKDLGTGTAKCTKVHTSTEQTSKCTKTPTDTYIHTRCIAEVTPRPRAHIQSGYNHTYTDMFFHEILQEFLLPTCSIQQATTESQGSLKRNKGHLHHQTRRRTDHKMHH